MAAPTPADRMLPLILAAALGAFSASAGCVPAEHVDDPVGDVQRWPLPGAMPGADTAPVDMTRAWVADHGDHLEVGVQLAERPRPGEAYRYWIGFHLRLRGSWEYLDVRMHGDRHDAGWLVGGNAVDNPLLGVLPADWNGTSVSFQVPKQAILEAYGLQEAEWGSPRASADGPHPAPQVVMAVGSADWATTPAPKALPGCPPLEPLPVTGAVQQAPAPLAAVAAAGLLGAVAMRRRQRP